MREIKFRFINPDGKLYTLTLKELTELDSDLVYSENFRGQYTGLLDKNGVEIYEGDIVKFSFNEEFIEHGVVKWDSNDAGYVVYRSANGYLPLGGYQRVKYEVIGNIYENPELSAPSQGEEQ